MDTYDGTDLGSTDGTSDGKFEVLLLGDSPGSLYRLKFGCSEVTELYLSGDRFLGTTLSTYYGTEIGF